MGIITIKDSRTYQKVFTQGSFQADRLLVLYRRPNRTGESRFGFAVSRKLGGAVVRNRVRRRLKEICRRHQAVFPAGYDYVVIARPPAVEAEYRALEGSLLKLAGSLR
jgi:ribonuclease P protein component